MKNKDLIYWKGRVIDARIALKYSDESNKNDYKHAVKFALRRVECLERKALIRKVLQ
jgi:hypothetical protein